MRASRGVPQPGRGPALGAGRCAFKSHHPDKPYSPAERAHRPAAGRCFVALGRSARFSASALEGEPSLAAPAPHPPDGASPPAAFGDARSAAALALGAPLHLEPLHSEPSRAGEALRSRCNLARGANARSGANASHVRVRGNPRSVPIGSIQQPPAAARPKTSTDELRAASPPCLARPRAAKAAPSARPSRHPDLGAPRAQIGLPGPGALPIA